jgi:trigger factor
LAQPSGCKRSLEIAIPAPVVDAEIARAAAGIQSRARLKGFRPGKAPASIVRREFAGDIRRKVLESLVPKYLQKQFEAENLRVVGTPDIKDVHLHEGQPLRFTAEFEVTPEFELGEYHNVEIAYHDPEVAEEDVAQRLEELRRQKAQFVNLDPRPIQDGDFAVVAMHSLAGVPGEPVKQDELALEIGDPDTLEAFTENLRGLTPGQEKEFDVAYPADYPAARLAGRTVRFHATVKGIRRRELPDLNDEFAQDLGDFRDLAELRESVRKALLTQRRFEAQREAKNQLVEKLAAAHDFPVPDALVERQIDVRIEDLRRRLTGAQADIDALKLDWTQIRDSHREKAAAAVKASLLLERIAEREAIVATRGEVDREVERLARQEREPLAALQRRFEKDGTLERLARHIQTEKTLDFLFEHARKTAEG